MASIGASVNSHALAATVSSNGTPLPKGPSGAETSGAFPVAAKVIASNLNRSDSIPTKPPKLARSLEQQSLEMNFMRDGGRGANVSVIT